MVTEPELETTQIQGNVFPGFNKPFMTLLFFTMLNQKKCRLWLEVLAPQMATMHEVLKGRRLYRELRERLGHDPTNLVVSWANVCISEAGLRRLGVAVDGFEDPAFRRGMLQRSALLGDPTDATSEGNPANWVIGGSANMPDVMLIIGSDSAEMLESQVKHFIGQAEEYKMACIRREDGGVRGDLPGKEHFGFEDAISQPGIRGRASSSPTDFVTPREVKPTVLPQSLLYGRPGEDLIWPGEFIFGYPGQSPDPLVPGDQRSAGPMWARNGSFVVFRRLRQDVAEFRRFLAETAAVLAPDGPLEGITAGRLAALLVGRWPSGAPISRVPDGDNLALAEDLRASNYFGFGESYPPLPLDVADYPGDNFPTASLDPLGLVCPHASHIRKVNPRDMPNDDGGHMSQYRRRLLRRGLPFGPPYDKVPEKERGLLFISYQTSIEQQFEFLNGTWMGDRAPPRLPGGDDVFAGQNGRPGDGRVRRCVLLGRGAAPVQISTAGFKEWVIPTGGGYFFAPSIDALSRGLEFT